MAYIQRDTQRHTYGDYLTWSAEHGNELINGTAYVREPPAPSRYHQQLAGELFGQIWTALRDKPCQVFHAPFDVRLPKSGEADDQVDTVVQPDVLVVCDLQKLDERGMRGAPDWVAEVLSPSTASYDRIIKVPVYERAGVRELWLIQPTELTLAIYCLQDARYGHPTLRQLSGEIQLTAVPGVSIDWDQLLSHLRP